MNATLVGLLGDVVRPTERKGFRLVRIAKRRMYDTMTLKDLKRVYQSLLLRREEKESLRQEAEYVRHNIMLIQLCRGII